jgi:hypothetical protein
MQKRGGGVSSTTAHRRHHTIMLAGARRRAGLLLRAGVCRAFDHRASGRSGGAPEQWLLWPPRVEEEGKCCWVHANKVSDRKANIGVQANNA